MLGEAAALTTAFLWSVGSLLFRSLSERLGSVTTNLGRVIVAALVLSLLSLLRHAGPAPPMGRGDLWLLVVSGLVGLLLGDGSYFRSLVLVGARRATLLYALNPLFTALLAWLWLGEQLGGQALLGMACALGGTWWVVLERSPSGQGQGRFGAGSAWGVLAALAQAVGMVLAKGPLGRVAAFDAAVLRMQAAALAAVLALLLLSRPRRSLRQAPVFPVLPMLLAASTVGPVFGMWLSLVAIQKVPTAVAATLLSLVPIMVLPLVMVVDRERLSLRAVGGALLAVGGVILLLTRPG